jgi:hypothetical protein
MHQMTPTGENRILQSLSLNDLVLLQPQLKLIDLKRGLVRQAADRRATEVRRGIEDERRAARVGDRI